MKNKTLTKKIIAGKYKNKTLKLPPLSTTRSSKGIVLESFFNTVQFEIIDAVFVEVFSGSGSIGLEALSRGAKKVFFMEKDKKAFDILKENINQTDPSKCEIIYGDSFENIETVIKKLQQQKQQAYFYIDPPFSIREGMSDIYDKTVNLIKSLPKENVKLIAIEHMSSINFDETIGCFSKLKTKKFGKTSITYYGKD